MEGTCKTASVSLSADRLHDSARCYQHAPVTGGSHTYTVDGPCPSGPPAEKEWFDVRVEATGSTADVYLNEQFMVTLATTYSAVPWVGLATPNGLDNVMFFKDVLVFMGKIPVLKLCRFITEIRVKAFIHMGHVSSTCT